MQIPPLPPSSSPPPLQNDNASFEITNLESQSISNGHGRRTRSPTSTGNATLDIASLKKRDRLLLESESCEEDSESKKNKLDASSSSVSIEPEEKESCGGNKSEKDFFTGNPSNIYGESGGRCGGISYLGSWALRNCKEEGIMTTPGGVGGNERTNESSNDGTGNGNHSGGYREWYFETGTSFKFRVNHLAKVFVMLMVVIIVLALVFHTRIRTLENENQTLIHELNQMRMHLERVAERMEAVASEAVPRRSERVNKNSNDDDDNNDTDRVKRSARAEPSRTTKELQYSPATMSYNSLNSNDSAPFDSGLDDAWNMKSMKETRAAYLEIDEPSVSIKKSRLELIGPWYLPELGSDIGFNDMWYRNLQLDANGTSIIFQEDGLFLIYAQIFYQQQPAHNVKPTPMGYRIHLRKRRSGGRPVTRTIAECVPSFPTTYYQTCFTQVAWFVEEKDEVYLEHFTDSLPLIEAVKNGQTFLGIVRLSN